MSDRTFLEHKLAIVKDDIRRLEQTLAQKKEKLRTLETNLADPTLAPADWDRDYRIGRNPDEGPNDANPDYPDGSPD
jgi:hypothetical protein